MGVGLDGFSILNARKQIPTIMTSDTENTDIMLRAFALGAVEFLQKPLSDEKLRNIWQHAVRKALSAGEKTLPESLRSVKTMIHSFVNSPSATSPEQNSKETVDAAINEVLTNPWTPLPLGLKPPSLESVMTELQRQGISSVPPASA